MNQVKREKTSLNPFITWLAQYDEEDDFLCSKASNSLPEFTEKNKE